MGETFWSYKMTPPPRFYQKWHNSSSPLRKILPKMDLSTPTSTESRALVLLGQGIAPETVAASLGLSPSRISQLLSDESFLAKVSELRFESLSKHNARDSKYDTLEDALLVQLEDCIPLIHRPMELIKAISVLNAAKRRGSSTPDAMIAKQQVINLTVPVQIIQKFQTNLQGQVTKVGDQELITIQSGSLENLVKKNKELQNGGPTVDNGKIEAERSASAG